jgi:hypothetical protein
MTITIFNPSESMKKMNSEVMRVWENIFFREVESAIQQMRATQSARLLKYAEAFSIVDKEKQTAAVADVLQGLLTPIVTATDYAMSVAGHREH